MKKILLIVFVLLTLKTFGQDMIYLTNGNSLLGKIVEIKTDSVKFKNQAYPFWFIFSYPIVNVQFAFNNTGNYLIFSSFKPFTDNEKEEFIKANTRFRHFDIVGELNGKLLVFNIASETEVEISDGHDIKLNKDKLAFVIRKNGSHELFCAADKASPFLIQHKLKIDSLLAYTNSASDLMSTIDIGQNDYVVPDMQLIGRKVIEKVQQLIEYLHDINSGSIHSENVSRIIDNERDNLFFNHGKLSLVEASSIKTGEKSVYKLRDYLNRMIKKAGQFEKVTIDYADVSYATKFRKGPDGNYYGTVTFIQKIQGFNDSNPVYCSQKRLNLTFVLPPYSGPRNDSVLGWDVYLDDIGITETKKY